MMDEYYIKTCPRCKQTKSMDDFATDNSKRDGCKSYCRDCSKLYIKSYEQKHPMVYRRSYYKRKYNMTLKQVEELIRQQKGCCYLCDNALPDTTLYQHLEHNKETNQIYGIACHHCNVGISMFNHDPYLMVKVAKRMMRFRC